MAPQSLKRSTPTTGSSFPRIGLVMPSLNQADYLEEAIVSVVEQGYPNLWFGVLDGGSRDGSQSIIDRYSEHFAYWHSRLDAGQTAALIDGFERSDAELLGWLNSDDVLLPGALWAIAAAYRARPDAGLIGGNYVLIDGVGRLLRCKRHAARASLWAKYGVVGVNQPGSFFSRTAYEASGGLDPTLAYVMDTDLYFRLMTNGEPYVHVNRWLAGFRHHPQQKTAARDQTRTEHDVARQLKWAPTVPTVRWRYANASYRLWQTVNGNYIRMALETKSGRGQHWRAWARSHVTTPTGETDWERAVK